METFEFILSLLLISMVPISILMIKGGKRGTKRTKDSVTDQILGVKENIIATYQKELQRAHGRANRYKQQIDEYEEIDEDLEESGNNVVKFEDIKTLVKKAYPQAGKFLDLPFAKKEITKLTKGMTLEEVISVVEEFTGKKLGANLGSKQGTEAKTDTSGYF